MKKLIALLGLISTAALAEQYPTIIGHFRNQDNGRIVVTTQKGECEGATAMVFHTANGGAVSGIGCWQKVGDQLFVIWKNTGDFYSYPLDEIIWSQEWTEFSNKK